MYNLILKCLLAISIILNVYLIYKFLILNNRLALITDILTEIRSSGFVRRIHMGNSSRALRELSSHLNYLMDKFQNIIEQKQKLELAHKKLISNISHDIRTPLTSMLGFVEVLQKNDNIDLTEQKEYLHIINSKGQSLYNLIQDFFELSRLEAEDVEIKLEKVDLVEILADTIASFYEKFNSAEITPEISLPTEHIFVWGHVPSIERILNNLLSNALKYGTDGGAIGISLTEEKDKAVVSVWDNGRGIPEGDLPFVFNRLYTVENSRNDKLRGSGLGLAIVKQLVEKQNGSVTVISNAGKTVFSFSLIKN